jgi:hypothetical protein
MIDYHLVTARLSSFWYAGTRIALWGVIKRTCMLPDSKISQLLSFQIPGLTNVMWQYRATGPLYEVIHVFADYTKRKIRGNRPVKAWLPVTLQQLRTQQIRNSGTL